MHTCGCVAASRVAGSGGLQVEWWMIFWHLVTRCRVAPGVSLGLVMGHGRHVRRRVFDGCVHRCEPDKVIRGFLQHSRKPSRAPRMPSAAHSNSPKQACRWLGPGINMENSSVHSRLGSTIQFCAIRSAARTGYRRRSALEVLLAAITIATGTCGIEVYVQPLRR